MVKKSIFRKGIMRLLNYRNNGPAFHSTVRPQDPKPLPLFTRPSISPPSDLENGEKYAGPYGYPKGTDQGAGDHFLPCDNSLNLLNAYLLSHENCHEDIYRLKRILELPRIIFEIGCGSGETAHEIALKNPHLGVIATDQYDYTVPVNSGSHYFKVALAWREKQLKIQEYLPDNLVVLRAEADILRFFPDHCIDSVLMLNPEPAVCESFLKFVGEESWFKKIKAGPDQIIVVPFSREMRIVTCGGFECTYTEECPGELRFLKVNHFKFRRGKKRHWGLDLTRASAYSRNSAQNDVYVFGNEFKEEPLSTWDKVIRKIF